MVADAANSLCQAKEGGFKRTTVNLKIPELPTVDPADLDPWPGGIRQVSREAQPLLESLVKAVVGGSSTVRSTVVDAESGCIQYVGEGEKGKN